MEATLVILNILVLLGEAALVYVAIGAKAYSAEKGKNLATKEDIAGITREIESVRSEYAKQLQMFGHENALERDADQRRHQFSMAALDQRLAAHQKAFALWREMIVQATARENSKFLVECQTWWEEHCLYLTPEASNAFWRALSAAAFHQQALGVGGKTVEDNWDKLIAAGSVITSSVQLPGLDLETLKSRVERNGDG